MKYACVALAACVSSTAAPPPRHAPVEAFALAPYDDAAPARARITRTLDGALAGTIEIETGAWASPTRTLVRARSGETWLATCEDYDAAQARCPHPIWIRVYPGAHVHRTTPP